MHFRPRPFGFGFSCVMLFSWAANAQDGFAINRFEPSDRGSDWFVTDSLDYRGKLRPVIGVTGDWAYKPLVWYRDDEEYRAIIRHQVFAHVGAALIIEDLVRLGVSLPVLAYEKASAGTIGGSRLDPSGDPGIGDLRLGASVSILGSYRSPFSLAAGVWGYVPTGSQEAYAGDGRFRLGPHVMMAGDIGRFAYAARLGGTYRAEHGELAGGSFGSEVFLSASAGFRSANKQWLVGPEVYTSTVVSESDALFSVRSTPVEGLLGVHWSPTEQWKFSLGGGPGLTRGFGAPVWRTVASIEWSGPVEKPKPEPARKDTDGDGIYDDEDACVEEPGIATDDPETNGCPERDTDGDGILDPEDACVDEKGKPSDDPEKNGCPDRDADGDGILDDQDACPNEPGPASDDPKKHGCPLAVVERGQIRILERVEFETAKATILPESETILNAVEKVLKDNPQITKVSVEGHTDSRANDNFNLNLSRKRAAAVVKWLVDHGIDAARLTSQGFGETKPIDSNDTDEGRQNNRRVEFRILEENAKAESQSE